MEKLAQSDHALTAVEVARILNCHKLTVYRLAKQGRIPGAFYIGTMLRFHPRKFAAYLEGGR